MASAPSGKYAVNRLHIIMTRAPWMKRWNPLQREVRMKAYLAITGTIFALFALGHFVELVARWNPVDVWFMVGLGAIIVSSLGLSGWAFRLLRASRQEPRADMGSHQRDPSL
jgi:hypothetical protein